MIATKVTKHKTITNEDVKRGNALILPKSFSYNGYKKNNEFVKGCIRFDDVRSEALRTCLYGNNSGKFERRKTGIIIRTEPKWLTTLKCRIVDAETGEIDEALYQTDDLKKGNARKIKKLDEFCSFYQPQYQRKKISMFLLTFTEADQAIERKKWSRMIDDVKYRFKSLGYDVLGYIWTMEISSDNYHLHYHLCVSVKRMNLRGKSIPEQLKFEGLWHKRTQIEFVKKNVRNYLSQYFAKNRWRITDDEGKIYRNFGMSNKLN